MQSFDNYSSGSTLTPLEDNTLENFVSKILTTPGTVIGSILVIAATKGRKRSNVVYRLKCLKCKRQFTEILPDIRNGKQKACGCLKRQWEQEGTKNWKRLFGFVKGWIRLIVPTTHRAKGGYVIWEAKCERCDRCFTISTNVLRHSVSCGCYKRDVQKRILGHYRDSLNEQRYIETKVKFKELNDAIERL